MEDAAKRMAKAGKGAGMGVGLMSALGAAAVGLYQSVYTGKPTPLIHFSLLLLLCKFEFDFNFNFYLLVLFIHHHYSFYCIKRKLI